MQENYEKEQSEMSKIFFTHFLYLSFYVTKEQQMRVINKHLWKYTRVTMVEFILDVQYNVKTVEV